MSQIVCGLRVASWRLVGAWGCEGSQLHGQAAYAFDSSSIWKLFMDNYIDKSAETRQLLPTMIEFEHEVTRLANAGFAPRAMLALSIKFTEIFDAMPRFATHMLQHFYQPFKDKMWVKFTEFVEGCMEAVASTTDPAACLETHRALEVPLTKMKAFYTAPNESEGVLKMLNRIRELAAKADTSKKCETLHACSSDCMVDNLEPAECWDLLNKAIENSLGTEVTQDSVDKLGAVSDHVWSQVAGVLLTQSEVEAGDAMGHTMKISNIHEAAGRLCNDVVREYSWAAIAPYRCIGFCMH